MSKKKFAHRQSNSENATAPQKKKIIVPDTGVNSMANWFAVLLVILPLLISREAMDPAVTIRYIFLSGFLLVFALYFFVYKNSAVVISGLPRIVFILGLAFFAWSMISMFSAINKPAAWYELLRQLLFLAVLFVVMQLAAREENRVLLLCKVLLCIATVHSFIGIFQFYGIAFVDLPGANATPFGLMANRNLYGSAQALLLPFTIFVFYQASRKWKYAAVVAVVLIIISLVLSQTRSAWLSALIMLVVAFLLVIIFSPVNRRHWIVGTAAFLGIAALLSFLLISLDKDGELATSVKERAMTLAAAMPDSTETSGNVNERLLIWKKTSELITDKPLMGVGPANWKLAIPAYGTDDLVWAAGNFVPDRVHNIYLQVAAETGLPGLLLFIATWVLVGIIGLIVVRRTNSESSRVLAILMLAGIAGFATDGMFSFPLERIEHCLYLALMGGILLGLYAAHTPVDLVQKNKLTAPARWTIVAIAFLNLVMAYKKHNFEVHLNYAKAYEAEGRYDEVLREVEAGKSSWVTVDMVGMSLETKSSIAYREKKDYPRAIEESRLALHYNPNSAMVYNNMGTIYTYMKDNAKAIESYEKARKLAPKFEVVLKNLGVNYFALGNYKASADVLGRVAFLNDPYLVNLLNESRRLSQLPSTDSLR